MAWTKVGSGTINKSKQTTGAPYYGRCTLTIDGREHLFEIGGWVKEGKEGSKFFSLAFSVKNDETAQAPAKATDESSDVPF